MVTSLLKYDLFRTKLFLCLNLTNERSFDNITNRPKVIKKTFYKNVICHKLHVKNKFYFESLARCFCISLLP